MPEDQGENSQLEEIKPDNNPVLKARTEWQNDLRRLIRRSQIYQQMGAKTSIKEIKDTVREYETRLGVEELADSLVSEELVIQPRMARVAQKLQEELVKDFPEIKAVVLLESSVHGGASIREATSSQKEPDLDWGIIFSKKEDFGSSERIVNKARALLRDIAKKENLFPHFHSCHYVNPINFRTTELSEDDIVHILKSVADGKLGPENILLFLQPSFPPEVGQKNRAIIFEGLSKLAREDESAWRSVVEYIMDKWQAIHHLSKKHFYITPKKRDYRLLNKVVSKSPDVMGLVMRELLESTNKKEGFSL